MVRIVESGPIPAIHGVVRWRLIDLAQWVFGRPSPSAAISKQTLSRELRALGFSQIVGPAAASCPGRRGRRGGFKNFRFQPGTDRRCWEAAGKPIEIWFEDEARIGQKNKITRRWARRGTRPIAPRDQRTCSAYIFGAICPLRGTAAGLVLPRCNTAAMALHLAEISQAGRTGLPRRHLLLDQAGWHLSDKLAIPANITLMPLPPKSPELNPVENIWQFIRDNWLSNPDIPSPYDDIVDHCSHAWNKLVDQPWTIMSIGLRDWAHRY